MAWSATPDAYSGAVADESRYRISVEEFDRRTPKVHARPVDPDDPDGEMTPASAFAMVEQPEPPPNPNTVEGFVAGIGAIGSRAAGGGSQTAVGRRAAASQRWLILLIALPFVIAVVVGFFH